MHSKVPFPGPLFRLPLIPAFALSDRVTETTLAPTPRGREPGPPSLAVKSSVIAPISISSVGLFIGDSGLTNPRALVQATLTRRTWCGLFDSTHSVIGLDRVRPW